MAPKRLLRSHTQRMIGGVCGGVAEYLDVDPTVVRVGWILLVLAFGTGIFAYFLCWLIMPEH